MTLPCVGDRRHLQHFGKDELRRSVVGVLVQQFVQHGAGLGRVAVEEVCLVPSHPLGTLAPRSQWSVERQVAEQVERIGVGLSGGLGQLVKVDAAFLQPVDDLGTPGRIGPVVAQVGGVGEQRPHLLAGVVGELHDAELLAVGVEFVDQVGGDLDRAAIEVEFPALALDGSEAGGSAPIVFFRLARPFRAGTGSPSAVMAVTAAKAGSPSKSGSANSRVAEPV